MHCLPGSDVMHAILIIASWLAVLLLAFLYFRLLMEGYIWLD
jgi:hypothetical protein